METTGERGDIPSQQCSNCECSLARCWCLDCDEALCDECVSAHRRVTLTRSHRLLNQPSDDSGFISPTKFCKLHSSEPLKLFCLTCVQLTCRDCQLESHKNHSFSFVSEASENLKKQLDTYRQLLGQKMEESTRSLRDMETRLKFLSCCELFQTVDLQRVFKMLVQFLKRRFDCLLKEVKKIYKSEKEMIKDRMLKVKQLQESHKSMSGAVQKAWNTTDLLVLVNCTEQVKPQLMDLVRQDLSPPPNMTSVSIHTDSKFVEDLLTFGKVQESWIPFSVSEQLTKEMEKLSDLSLSSFPLTITPPATSSQLSSFTTNSNSVFSPVSSKTNSSTSSSSSSIQSGFSSKTSPQTRTSTDAIQPVQVSHSTSHHSCPPLSSSSNLLSSNLTVSNLDTRENPVSLVASVSPFTMRSPSSTSPSSSALTSDSPSLSQTLNICDPPRTTAGHHSVSAFPSTLTSLVPPISSLSSPKDPLTGTTMSTAINTVLHRSSLISPPSQATKGPETSESNVTTTKCPASFGKINILSRSQLESDTSKFYKFRYKKSRACRTVKTSPFRCLKPKGSVDATTSSPLQMFTSSSSFTTSVTSSTSCPPSVQQVLPQAAPPTAQTENIQPISSTLPPSAKPRTYTLMPVQSSNQQAVELITTSSTPPVGVEHHVPVSKSTNSGQKVLVLKRQSVHGQTQSSLVLLTDPQSPAQPSLFSDSSFLHPSFSSFPFALPQTLSFMSQPLTSILPPVAGPNLVQSLQVLNQNLVPSLNQPALVQLNNTENAYLVSGSGLNPFSVSPQFPVLLNNSALCNISTVQDSCANSWVIPVSLVPQVSPLNATKNISPVTQCCSTSSKQQSLTNPSCAGSNSQVFSHKNQTSDTGPSLLNGQQQNLESKMVVGSSYSVQNPKMYQQSEVDKQPTSVSGPATVEFGETRPAEKLSSSATPQIKETATISEETKPAGEMSSSKMYQVTQNIINSEEIHLIVGPISPASPDGKLTICVEEMDPAGKQSSSKAHVVEPVTTRSEKNKCFDRLMSSDDELTIVSPVEAKPAGSCFSPGMDGVERTLVRSGEIKPFGQFSPSGESDPSGKQPPPDGYEDEYIGAESDKSRIVVNSFSPISSDDELTIVSPVEAKHAGSWFSPGMDGVERTLVRSEEIKPFGQFSPSGESGPSGKQPPPDGYEDEYIGTESDKSRIVVNSFSPISSDDELTIVSPVEAKPAGSWFSPGMDGVERTLVRSEEIKPFGQFSPSGESGPSGKQPPPNGYEDEYIGAESDKSRIVVNSFSPISSDDELTIVSPVEAKPAGSCFSPGMDGVERTLVRSEESKPFGQFLPLGESDPSGKQPPPDGYEDEYIGTESDKSRIVVSSFSPISSDDEPLALSEDEDSPVILPLSETPDSKNEDTKTSRQQDFSQPQWQPKVSLARLPVHLPPKATLLPSFYSVLQDGKEEIYLQESIINMPDDASNDGSNEDVTDLSSSPGSPLSVEIISCAACSSPNASKICSDCGRGYHKDCHIPPVGPDIWSEWICSLCQDLTDPSDPYSSDRSQSPQTRLSLQNQRRCETLLLHLKVEGCRQFSESDFWTNLMLISERLTHHRPPPYQSSAQLVSDLWIIFQDASQDDALSSLEQSFQKKLVELLGSELHPSLLKALDTNIPCDDGSTSASNSNNYEEENFPPRSQLKDLKKKLRAFLDLKTPAAKRAKKN